MLDEIIIAKKQKEKRKELSCIYSIVNLIDGKLYVGSTINFKNRSARHLSALKNNKHDNEYLQRAFNKYGVSNFLINILEQCDSDNLVVKEQYYIDFFKSYQDSNGYNLVRFVEQRRRHTKRTRDKIKIACGNKKRKTHCKNGHEFNLINTYCDKKTGHRNCKICNHERYLRKAVKKETPSGPVPSDFCNRGHKFTINNSGRKRCRICENLKAKELRSKLNINKKPADECKYGHKKEQMASGKMVCRICAERYREKEKLKQKNYKQQEGIYEYCKYGHLKHITPSGRKRCKLCNSEYMKRLRDKIKKETN